MSTVRDLLMFKGSRVHVVGETATVVECARSMTELGVGSLVVTRGTTPIGIVTLHDIVRVIGRRPTEALQLAASEVMTASLHTAEEGAALEDVEATMKAEKIRHLPVTRDGEVVGLVTLLDVVNRHLRETVAMSTQLEEYIFGPRIS